MSNFTPINFDVFDYKNENVLSSYALPNTPFKFVPDIKNFNALEVLWDFGDNTKSMSLTGVKYYDEPGRYLVKLVIYDCFSNTTISTISKEIEIFDFLPKTFNVDFDDSNEYDNINWKCGKINGPVFVSAQYSRRENPVDIFYRVNNTSSTYYFDIESDKYNHLKNTHSFFEKIYNRNINSFQFSEIDRITIKPQEIYAKIDGNQIIVCDKNDSNSFFVGLSGSNEFYFKDDKIGKINVDLFFDKKESIEKWNNLLGITLSANIIENDDVDRLSITSNGLDGEFYSISSFKIDKEKFSGTDISFTIKIKDNENFTVKNFPPLSSSISFSVLSADNIIDNNNYTLTITESISGSCRGYIHFNKNSTIFDVQLSASIASNNDQGTSYNLFGITDYFNVIPQDFLNIIKKNEDYDAKETYKGLRFQEFLLDYNTLFDDFLGSILGDSESSYDTLGKKTYEKITNFIENTQDIDRSEIYQLISLMSMMNNEENQFSSNYFSYPEKIKRIIDLGTISSNKLFGTNNKFRENFDIKGYASKDVFGVNLGNEINTDTYIISAGIPIVALEKFSNTYTLLNTQQPLEYTQIQTFPLSTYTYDWGWPLVLPDNYSYDILNKYYLFFEYIPTIEGSITENTIINKNDIENAINQRNVLLTENGLTLLTEEDETILINSGENLKNIMFKITLMDTLYQSLSLVK